MRNGEVKDHEKCKRMSTILRVITRCDNRMSTILRVITRCDNTQKMSNKWKKQSVIITLNVV